MEVNRLGGRRRPRVPWNSDDEGDDDEGGGGGGSGGGRDDRDANDARVVVPLTDADFARARRVLDRRMANFGILSPLSLQGGDAHPMAADMRARIWRDIIVEEKWSAQQAQMVASGLVKQTGNEDARGVADVADLLKRDDGLWEMWWKQDFGKFMKDIGPAIPAWIKNARSGPRQAGDPDMAVIYTTHHRRWYAWCEYFQRKCAKMILHVGWLRATAYARNFVFPGDVPVGVNFSRPTRASGWEISDDDKDVAEIAFSDAPEDMRPVSLQEVALNFTSPFLGNGNHGSPLLAWTMLDRVYGVTHMEPGEVPPLVAGLSPTTPSGIGTGLQGSAWRYGARAAIHIYRFNFDHLTGTLLTAFMLWYDYAHRKHYREKARTDQNEEEDDNQENRDSEALGQPGYIGDRPNGLAIAQALGWADATGENWPVFAEPGVLPIVPTRDGIRFIGAECLTCQAPDPKLREKANHDMTFCSALCQAKFHQQK